MQADTAILPKALPKATNFGERGPGLSSDADVRGNHARACAGGRQKAHDWAGRRSVAQWLEHRSPNSAGTIITRVGDSLNVPICWHFLSAKSFAVRFRH
jgi:hypothetical protein